MQLVRDGRIVLCNDMAQKLFQYTERNIPVGVRIAEFIYQWASKIEKYPSVPNATIMFFVYVFFS
ncbi:MAG: hypothetical protein LBC02_03685 [Planctomycetaceae bacterium]|nr:hypothetical protein [Planctomycetaceae bacterium]